MKRSRIILFSCIMLLLVLTACTGGLPFVQDPARNQNRNYYQGNDGVIMRFSDPTTPPARMFFYEGGTPIDNSFQVLIDVHNIGSSWTAGALYISGYDPYMIRIDNMDIPRTGNGFWSNCFFDINPLGGGNFRSSANCENLDLDVGGGGFQLGSNDLGRLADSLGIGGVDFLDGIGVSIDTYGDTDIGISTNFANLDLFNNGVALLIWANVSGLDLTRFNGLNYQGNPAGLGMLHPDNPEFPGGEVNTINFDGDIRAWPQGLDQTDRPITFLVTNCFLYSTVATPQVCIDPQPFDLGVKVCQPRPTNFNGGNGAPVAISVIEQENSRQKVFFEITVQNVGGGTVFDVGAMEACSPYYPGRLTAQHLNRVHILDARIGSQQLDCTPGRGDPVRLVNGRGTFRCTYDLEYATARSAYETPIILELGYGYSTTMQRRTTIRRVI